MSNIYRYLSYSLTTCVIANVHPLRVLKPLSFNVEVISFHVLLLHRDTIKDTKKEIKVITNYPNLFLICFYSLLQRVELNTHPR